MKDGVAGLGDALKGLNDAIERVGGATLKAMEDVTLDLRGKAVEDAPVDTGDLRGSGYSHVERTKDGYVGTVGFSVPYALKQDQDRTLNHPRGGKAGYLSDNLTANAKRYAEHIKNEVRRGGA